MWCTGMAGRRSKAGSPCTAVAAQRTHVSTRPKPRHCRCVLTRVHGAWYACVLWWHNFPRASFHLPPVSHVLCIAWHASRATPSSLLVRDHSCCAQRFTRRCCCVRAAVRHCTVSPDSRSLRLTDTHAHTHTHTHTQRHRHTHTHRHTHIHIHTTHRHTDTDTDTQTQTQTQTHRHR